jgi:hypothetical protein
MLMAMFNTGYQAFLSVEQGGTLLDSWQAVAYGALGLEVSSTSVLGCMVYGALHFVPILLVTFAAGGACEVLFAVVRGHEVNEGLLVTGVLIPLTLPSTIPLWQVAMGNGVRGGDRQGNIRRHRHELSESGARCARVSVLRVSGADLRQRVGRRRSRRWAQRGHLVVVVCRRRGSSARGIRLPMRSSDSYRGRWAKHRCWPCSSARRCCC